MIKQKTTTRIAYPEYLLTEADGDLDFSPTSSTTLLHSPSPDTITPHPHPQREEPKSTYIRCGRTQRQSAMNR